MESEEKVVKEAVAEKPKAAPRKTRSTKSAAQRKADKAKSNAEKATAAAAKTANAADAVKVPAEIEEKPTEPVAAASTEVAGALSGKAAPAKKPAARKTTKSTSTSARAKRPAAKKTTKEAAPEAPDSTDSTPPKAEKQSRPAGEAEAVQMPAVPAMAETVAAKSEPEKAVQEAAPKQEAEQQKPKEEPKEASKEEPKEEPKEKPEVKPETESLEEAEEPEETEEEKRRAAEITRTVQVSIEQILARAAEQQEKERATAAPGPESEEETEEPEPIVQRLGEAATDSLRGLFKWALLVFAFVVVIAGFGVYWLYHSATPEMLPQLTLTMDGQTVEATEYRWHVPVVSNMFKRTYAETISKKPIELANAIESNEPELILTPSEDYETALTVTDSNKEEVFNGTLEDFNTFTFAENGMYIGKLVVTCPESRFAGSTLVTGNQTYQFAFKVDIRPTVRINTQSITQGGVVSVRVTGIPADEIPALHTTLNNTGFVKATNGWVAYLPVPCEADTSESYTITVKTDSYDQDLSLTVRPRTSAYKDYNYAGAMTSPYIGVDDTPDEVRNVLDICDPQVYWTASGFVQPFIHSITVTLPFGTTEYVGRTATQRAKNTGEGRTSTCVVVTGRQGEDLISPADGRVVLAKDLGGTAGNTVVIEHGAGLKSVFYNLYSIDVQEGSSIRQGQPLGKTQKVTVGEVRIGQVPVEPLSIWRGQCDAVKTF